MPQMKPLMWLNNSLMIYLFLYMMFIMINSFPMMLIYMNKTSCYTKKKWNWMWF